MKKFISFCLAISMIISVFPVTTLAVEMGDQSLQETDKIQQEIDAIFTELNGMAAEEKMAEFLAEENTEMEEKLATLKARSDQRKRFLENRLESLGVNTIDPNDPEDMAGLEEVMLGNSGTSVLSISDPPDLASIAECYTLRQYTDSITVNGTSYSYSYIYVTDDKEYSGSILTSSQTHIELIGKETVVLGDVLEYQFSFGLSAYLGSVPYGWLADWAIGSVCAALESYNQNSNISHVNNGSIYTMSMISVTQMMYTYVYLPSIGDWYLCGTCAPYISYARAETVVANVAGKAVSSAKEYPTLCSSTGTSAANYVRAYVNGGDHDIDSIGLLSINAYKGKTVRFTPGFAPYPIHLI